MCISSEPIYQNYCRKEIEIMSIRNRVFDLEQRVSEQETYTSKDCIIIETMPHLDMKLHLRELVCLIFERYLGFTTNAYNIKACHDPSRRRDERYPPAIIVKFLYFDEKKRAVWQKIMACRKINRLTLNQYS